MRPNHYVTIEILRGTGGLSSPQVAGILLWELHGVFHQLPGRYAIALTKPTFSGVRVFASSRDDLDVLHQTLQGKNVVKNYCRFGYPQIVPDNYDGAWKSYARYRIPSRKAERNEGGMLRLKRIEHADKNGLPYFILKSQSNGQSFGLYVNPQPGKPNVDDCRPDSYGLAVATRPFCVPDIP